MGRTISTASEDLPWVEGLDLFARQPFWVPEAIASLYCDDEAGTTDRFWQSTDGLASGNTLLEAINHGLNERIERDAVALASFLSADDIAERRVGVDAFGDDVLSDLAPRIRAAGLRLSLFDVTSDLGVPVFLAVVAPGEGSDPSGWSLLDAASGSGAHPLPVRAALRAVTEAAQSRLTNISGARDDIFPEEYETMLPASMVPYLPLDPDPARGTAGTGLCGRRRRAAYHEWMLNGCRPAASARQLSSISAARNSKCPSSR